MIRAPIAIWLYGSFARGEQDEHSDCDILTIGSERDTFLVGRMLSERSRHKVRFSVSRYDWQQIEAMAAYGSLFLHHVSFEGRMVWEDRSVNGRLSGVLNALPTYKRIDRDLTVYRRAVSDVRQSLCDFGSVPFELSVLATTLRHAAVLGCYIVQRPNFGRWSAIGAYAAHAGLGNWTAVKIHDLLDYKLWSEGRRPAPEHVALEGAALDICDEVETLIGSVKGDARCRGLISA